MLKSVPSLLAIALSTGAFTPHTQAANDKFVTNQPACKSHTLARVAY